MSTLIDSRAAAERFGYRNHKAFQNAVRREGIPHVRIGHVLRFDPAELDRYIDTLKRRRDVRIRRVV